MLTTVDLYDEPLLAAREVCEIRSDGKLPDELVSVQPSTTKLAP